MDVVVYGGFRNEGAFGVLGLGFRARGSGKHVPLNTKQEA